MLATQRSILATTLLWFLLLAVPSSGTSWAGLNPDLASLPDNTWLKLDPEPSERWVASGSCSGPYDLNLVVSGNPKKRSFSGMAYGDGKVFFFGGGHCSHPGNDVEIYDIAQNVWTQQFKPEICTVSCGGLYGGASIKNLSPLGQPYVFHTYQLQTYDTLRQQFILSANSGLFAFDLPQNLADKNNFVRLHPWPWPGDSSNKWPSGNNTIHNKLLTYDPLLQKVVFFDGDGSDKDIYQFDYDSGAWTFIDHYSSGGSHIHSAYDPIRKKHMIIDAAGVRWYDAVSNTWESIPNVPSGASGSHNLAYDTLSKVMIVTKSGSNGIYDKLYAYTAQGQWIELTPNGPLPDSARFGRWIYDAPHNVFILHNGGTWAYRYKAAGSTGDTTPPSTPQNVSANAMSPSSIDLTWAPSNDPESGVSFYRIFRDATFLASATSTAYADEGLSPNTTYIYQVSAVNGEGLASGQGGPSSATTLPDTTPPTISSVSTGAPTQLFVAFSEAVGESSATTISNYNVDNGIVISAASLAVDLRTVMLTTSAHIEGATYTLTVNNVTDRADTPNTISADTQVVYTFFAELIVSNLSVESGALYEVVKNLDNGSLGYIDRTFTYAAVPAELLGSTHIKTANDDKTSQGEPFLSFAVNQAVTIYLAHDDRYAIKPAWLGGFVDTGQNLEVNATFSLFAKEFPAGPIMLGGNVDPSEAEGNNMYVVIIAGGVTVPDAPPSPPTGFVVE